MGIKDVFNQAPSPKEEALYKRVLDEVKSNGYRDGIYAKAVADSMGDGGKAHSLYIKYRVQSLIDEERPVGAARAAVKSPKSVALPADAIVI